MHEQVLPITGTTHIHLDQVRARLDRAFNGLEGILVIPHMLPPMGHHHPAQSPRQRIDRPIRRPDNRSQQKPKNPASKYPTPFH